MNVTLTEDEVRLILQALGSCTVAALSPDAVKVLSIARSIAKKLQSKPPAKKKGK